MCFLVSVFHFQTLSQNSLTGYITNETGQAVGNAKINLDKSYDYALSDAEGFFAFKNLTHEVHCL